RLFVLVRPNEDILPVRAMYSGNTINIGNNYLTSNKAVWIAGPDLIASAIQTGKIPQVERAIRLVPHGKQTEMKSVNLRGMVEINPYTDDLFRRAIEQRKLHKSNKDLHYWSRYLPMPSTAFSWKSTQNRRPNGRLLGFACIQGKSFSCRTG